MRVRASRPLRRTLAPSPALCAQLLVPALGPVPKAFKPFWPPALLQQALPAIILAALRRFRGPALFRGLRLSSSQCVPSWLSGLTWQSSGPAKGGPLTLVVESLLSSAATGRSWPRPVTQRQRMTGCNRCEAVVRSYNPNITPRSISTVGLSHVAASFHPNARHQHQSVGTTCLRIFRARSGRISHLSRAEHIGPKHTNSAHYEQITQANCTQFALRTQIIVHFCIDLRSAFDPDQCLCPPAATIIRALQNPPETSP